MSYETGILLGQITKVKDYEGIVTIRLSKSFTKDIYEPETVFLEYEGKPVPFFISWSEYSRDDTLNVRFKWYEKSLSPEAFSGCWVYLDPADSTADVGKSNINITGFRLLSYDKSLEATITEVIENPGQWLIKAATSEGKELLIPFHEDLVVSVNRKKRLIIMKLPEGLLDIN